MKTGVVLSYGKNIEADFRWCVENGIETCQLHLKGAEYTDETVTSLRSLCKTVGMEISALIGSVSGPATYDFYYGPFTIGIVAPGWGGVRAKELAESAYFASKLGVPRICCHMGFIPENPNDPAYASMVATSRWLARVYEQSGVGLDFETGQETPVTLRRTIEDIGSPYIGVNFDPANFLKYGKGNPVDSMDILGKYIKGFHAKDGDYPDDPHQKGPEMPLGEGRVDFPVLIQKLRTLGYDGPLTIEREISGERQKEDIKKGNILLKKLIG